MSAASELEQLTTRVRVVLGDQAGRIYTTEEIEEGIRQALEAYSVVKGEPVTIEGLDGAEETTLEKLYEGMLVLGAAGLVVNSRAVAQASAFNQDEKLPADLAAWAEKTVQAFHAQVEEITRLPGLHRAPVPPWSGWDY